MKYLFCILLLVSLAAGQNYARDQLTIAGNVDHTINPGQNFFGFSVGSIHNFTRQFGVEGEFDLLHQFGPDSDSNTPLLFLGGPRLQFPGNSPLTPFVHGLGGFTHSGFLHQDSASFFGGGGVDIRLTRIVSLREGLDYGWVNTTGIAQSGFRVVSGVVFSFGQKTGNAVRSSPQHDAVPKPAAKSQSEVDQERINQWWPTPKVKQ